MAGNHLSDLLSREALLHAGSPLAIDAGYQHDDRVRTQRDEGVVQQEHHAGRRADEVEDIPVQYVEWSQEACVMPGQCRLLTSRPSTAPTAPSCLPPTTLLDDPVSPLMHLRSGQHPKPTVLHRPV